MDDSIKRKINKIKGPILVIGAGGFVGFNLFLTLKEIRQDVFAVVRKPDKNWRFKKTNITGKSVLSYDISSEDDVKKMLHKIKPRTIFNLAAYGAYSNQQRVDKIYDTNFSSTIKLIEELKKNGFDAYIHAGSQSEYGLNSAGPSEDSQLIPNSHYAVSKTGNFYTIQYYGKVERMPLAHLRLYSVYGPWEEPDRLIPTLLKNARLGKFPTFVNGQISRDFIYVDDVVNAFITVAVSLKSSLYGEVFNIATGKKITIKELAELSAKMFKIKGKPKFGTMKNRRWDLANWYGNNSKARKMLGWKPETSIKQGLSKTYSWQFGEQF